MANSGEADHEKFKNWVFTINNYTQETINDLESKQFNEFKGVKWIAFSKEVAPTTGTPHLQGFLGFKNQVRFKTVQEVLGSAHIEPMRGNLEQNKKYCEKAGELIVYGQLPLLGQKRVVDYRKVIEWAEKGMMNEIKENEPRIYLNSYHRLIDIKYASMECHDTLKWCCGVWISGPPHCGKSEMARKIHTNIYLKCAFSKWWDGYEGQEMVLIDDLPKDNIMGHYFKTWVDKYPFRVEVKGHMMMIRPRLIVVTSNHSFEETYGNGALKPTDYEAVRRRFIWHYEFLKEDGTENSFDIPAEHLGNEPDLKRNIVPALNLVPWDRPIEPPVQEEQDEVPASF